MESALSLKEAIGAIRCGDSEGVNCWGSKPRERIGRVVDIVKEEGRWVGGREGFFKKI